MEDWQGCLSPLCQTTLQQARKHVLDRGGLAITVEDYLLTLIDSEPTVAAFLRRRGVDIDELTRTVQCEQPIVTTISSDGLLSSQLQYWFATARELSDAPWLDWPKLLKTLVHHTDRLSGKAYVAVLEQVGYWPVDEAPDNDGGAVEADGPAHPVVVTDSAWLQLAEDVAVTVSAQSQALIWLRGPRGAGKTTWLQAMMASLHGGFMVLDLRREAEVMASGAAVMPAEGGRASHTPLLILDNTSPADLLALMADRGGVASDLVAGFEGPILLLSPDDGDETSVPALECRLGRPVKRLSLPLADAYQNLAILTAHQPEIENRWYVELNESALRYASALAGSFEMTSGEVLQWVARAAARVALVAERGPVDRQRLAGEIDTVRRQLLVAIARNRPVAALEQALSDLSVERAAGEVTWYERQTAGTLRQVTVDDLRYELEHN